MLRKAVPLTWKPKGVSDAIDASNAFHGAMASLANLVPDPRVKGFHTCRPASSSLTSFGGFSTPAQIEGLLTVGAIAYGFVASARFAGKSEPFAFNVLTSTFLTLTGVLTGNCPTTQAATGDWTPPTLAQVGTKIMATHPGFPGGATKFGWFDVSSFTSSTITGSTHGTTTIDTLSTNVLLAGWTPGMSITGLDVPANTTVVSIAANGLSIVISNAATGSHAGSTFTVAGGTASSPQWAAGDTNGNNLSAVPVAVAQFNGRAWFAVKNGAVFSDSLNATQVTSASQALTFGNGINVTALGGLPLQSSTQGGMVQSLIAFQGDSNMVQIQGDAAVSTSPLTQNNIGVGVGTLAPNTICSTPLGLAFVAPDGLRLIDFMARVSDPIGLYGTGVAVPFINAISPSRMAAAYNDNVLRVSVKNGNDPNQATQEYWLDFDEKAWTGPHSFPAALIEPDQTSQGGFVMAATGINAQLWQAPVLPTVNSTYTENGVALTWTWTTPLLPDNEEMAMNAVVESTIGLALPPGESIAAQASDEAANVLDAIQISNAAVAGAMWDVAKWDVDKWAGGAGFYVQHPMPWHNALDFKQAQFQMTGNSILGLSIGALRLRMQRRGYMTQLAS